MYCNAVYYFISQICSLLKNRIFQNNEITSVRHINSSLTGYIVEKLAPKFLHIWLALNSVNFRL